MSTLQQHWRKGQNRFCLEIRGVRVDREGKGAVGEMGLNNVCTYK
jgi:hypothetical protein